MGAVGFSLLTLRHGCVKMDTWKRRASAVAEKRSSGDFALVMTADSKGVSSIKLVTLNGGSEKPQCWPWLTEVGATSFLWRPSHGFESAVVISVGS